LVNSQGKALGNLLPRPHLSSLRFSIPFANSQGNLRGTLESCARIRGSSNLAPINHSRYPSQQPPFKDFFPMADSGGYAQGEQPYKNILDHIPLNLYRSFFYLNLSITNIKKNAVADLSRGCDCALTTGISAWKNTNRGT